MCRAAGRLFQRPHDHLLNLRVGEADRPAGGRPLRCTPSAFLLTPAPGGGCGPVLAMPANKKKDPRYAEIYRDMPGYAGI